MTNLLKLVDTLICILGNLITKTPMAFVLVAAVMIMYYRIKPLLLKKLPEKFILQGSDSTERFLIKGGEFLIVFFVAIALSVAFGLLHSFKEIGGDCIK